MSLQSSFGKFSDDFSVDENFIIVKDRSFPGKVDNFEGFFDIKDFYNKLINILTYNNVIRLYDTISTSQDNKKKKKYFGETIANLGEHIEMGQLRSGNNFEKRFLFRQKENNLYEIEWEIEARAPLLYSPYSQVYIKVEMCNRFSPKKEVVENGVKKTLYGGKWEFRNTYTFYNTLIIDYLDKIPFIKNNNFLKEIYIEKIASKGIIADIRLVDSKVVPMVQGFIGSYFKKVL